ncbi:DUF2848 family protein [Streptomyces sp. NPDC058471]|uniref:DUF2848 family protein n=1 Tax=Streptomyces sp. NPDC058471 TaxID=3346516 RepID=UPI00365DAFDC
MGAVPAQAETETDEGHGCRDGEVEGRPAGPSFVRTEQGREQQRGDGSADEAREGVSERGALIWGTIPLAEGVDQFAEGWRVELGDPATGNTIQLSYRVVPLPAPIG